MYIEMLEKEELFVLIPFVLMQSRHFAVEQAMTKLICNALMEYAGQREIENMCKEIKTLLIQEGERMKN